jgi:hypothetical protein
MDSTVTAVPLLGPASIALSLLCIVALIRPLPDIGLSRRRTTILLLAASLFGVLFSLLGTPLVP